MFLALISVRSIAFAKMLQPFAVSLAVLVAGAAQAGFVDRGGGVILDKTTNLEWEQNANHKPYDWAGAKAYAAGLALAGGGWKLPEIGQLQQLYDDINALGGCVDDDCRGNQGLFTGIQQQYWSVTEVTPGKVAQDFFFSNGCQCRNDEGIGLSVWAVRPAPEPASIPLFGAAALGWVFCRRTARRAPRAELAFKSLVSGIRRRRGHHRERPTWRHIARFEPAGDEYDAADAPGVMQKFGRRHQVLDRVHHDRMPVFLYSHNALDAQEAQHGFDYCHSKPTF